MHNKKNAHHCFDRAQRSCVPAERIGLLLGLHALRLSLSVLRAQPVHFINRGDVENGQTWSKTTGLGNVGKIAQISCTTEGQMNAPIHYGMTTSPH
jgi:hypothetical protein